MDRARVDSRGGGGDRNGLLLAGLWTALAVIVALVTINRDLIRD